MTSLFHFSSNIEQEFAGETDLENVVQPHDLEEARYILSKLIGMTLNQATLAAQREANNKELQSQVKQVLERDAVHQSLLQHVLANSDLELYNLLTAGTAGLSVNEEPASSRSRSPSPSESVASTATNATFAASTRFGAKKVSKKARRLTFAAPEDLLFPEGDDAACAPSLPPPIIETPAPEPAPVSRSPSK